MVEKQWEEEEEQEEKDSHKLTVRTYKNCHGLATLESQKIHSNIGITEELKTSMNAILLPRMSTNTVPTTVFLSCGFNGGLGNSNLSMKKVTFMSGDFGLYSWSYSYNKNKVLLSLSISYIINLKYSLSNKNLNVKVLT